MNSWPRFTPFNYTAARADYLNTVGDFNGDGFADLAFGNVLAGFANSGGGAVLVVYGSANGLLNHGNMLVPNNAAYAAEPDEWNKFSYYPVCDAQGCRPLILCGSNSASGAPTYPCDAAQPSPPPVTLGLDSVNQWQYLSGIQNVGDLDGDGTDDLAVMQQGGATRNYPNAAGVETPVVNAGKIVLLYGSSTNGIHPDRKVTLHLAPQFIAAPTRQMSFISSGGDLNGDGLSDFAVGAFIESSGLAGTSVAGQGAVYAIYGINGGYSTYRTNPEMVCTGGPAMNYYPCEGRLLGISNNPATNLTANHSPMQLVHQADGSCDPITGRCNVLRFIARGELAAASYFGMSLQIPGDLNQDGFADLVAAPARAIGGGDRVYVFFGSRSGLRVAGAPSLTPACASQGCNPARIDLRRDPAINRSNYATGQIQPLFRGGSVGRGDVNGDGLPDLLIQSVWASTPDGQGIKVGGFYLFK